MPNLPCVQGTRVLQGPMATQYLPLRILPSPSATSVTAMGNPAAWDLPFPLVLGVPLGAVLPAGAPCMCLHWLLAMSRLPWARRLATLP